MINIKDTIDTVLADIQARNAYKPVELKDERGIVKDLGFSSLDVAELIATLEIELGVDPFAKGASITDLRTVGDLHALYAASFEKKQQEVA